MNEPIKLYTVTYSERVKDHLRGQQAIAIERGDGNEF